MITIQRQLVLISLLLLATAAFGDTKTWTGTVSTLWSVGGNWDGGVAPVNGDVLVFPHGAGNTNTVNDLVGLTLTSMSFPSLNGNFGVNGNAFTLNAGVDNQGTLGWNAPTTLGASQTFLAGHTTRFFQTITLNGHTLTLQPYVTTFFAGSSIVGTGDVIMMGTGGTGGTQLSGSINITGTVSLTAGADINVEGTISAANVVAGSGSIVSGAGTLPSFTSNGATIRPGHAAGQGCCGFDAIGILTTGSLSANGGVLSIGLVTPVPGTGHDQLAVNGTVTLSNPTLTVTFPAAVPPAGTSFVIIANDGTDPVSGTFAGLPEGTTFTVGATALRITYAGGTGNDVVLTAVNATTTTLNTDPNPSGGTVVLTIHVAAVPPASGIPTGSVSIFVDGQLATSGVLDANGDLVITLTGLSPGLHDIRADYTGDASFGASSATVAQQVIAPIPTLSTWMMMLFAVAIATIALRITPR